MYIIVPLAGPDLVLKDGSFRPLFDYDGEPILKKILKNRLWYKSGEVQNKDIIFVLREVENLSFFIEYLQKEFGGSRYVIVSSFTTGALSSSLAAMSLISDYNKLICIDLVDIDYDVNFSVSNVFKNDLSLHGLLLTFSSENPKFSYLKTNKFEVLECAEKKVISDTASAGTYFYKDLMSFLEAAKGSYEFSDTVAFKNALFICPSYNFLISKKLKVEFREVTNIVNLSTVFHV